jgi:hypothetical protein
MPHRIVVSARASLTSAAVRCQFSIFGRPTIDRSAQPSRRPEYSLGFLFGSADDFIHQAISSRPAAPEFGTITLCPISVCPHQFSVRSLTGAIRSPGLKTRSWRRLRIRSAQKCDKAVHDEQKYDRKDQEKGRSVRHRMIQKPPKAFLQTGRHVEPKDHSQIKPPSGI